MDPQFIGKKVSLEIKSLGFYQGTIVKVSIEGQTITIKDAFQNGKACERSILTFSVQDIEDLKFLDHSVTKEEKSSVAEPKSSTVQVRKKARPVAENLARKITQPSRFSPAMSNMGFGNHSNQMRNSPASRRNNNGGSFAPYDNKNNRGNTPKRFQMRDEDCFGNLDEEDFGKEFDFEENLALFNKKMVFEEIEGELTQQNQPDVVRLVDCNRRPKNPIDQSQQPQTEPKYRNDENVLMSMPVQYRPIETGEEFPPGEYVTDSGLIVPAMSFELRSRLEKAMEAKGYGSERLIELMARSGVEVALQLFGGAHRLNPGNSHQVPLAVILCGLSRSGAIGLATARHLASQGVRTIVYLPDLPHHPPSIAQELALYKMSGQKWTFSAKVLPSVPVDLIICALEDHEMWEQERRQPWLRNAQKWANDARAPVLSIDPPNEPQEPILNSKIILVPGLPIWHGIETSKIYMANLAVPKKIYSEVGIKFESPFGPKAVIPLHKVS